MGEIRPWYTSIRLWVFVAALAIVIVEASVPGWEIDVERLKSLALVFSSFLLGESIRSIRQAPGACLRRTEQK